MSAPTPDILVALRKARYLKMVEVITAPPAAHPLPAPEADIIGQLAVADLLKQGQVFDVPISGEPHIVVRRHTTRWPGGPVARSLCVPKTPEGTLTPRLVADLRKCERQDALDGARYQLLTILGRRGRVA